MRIDCIQRDGTWCVVLLVIVAMAGCDRGPERAPVEGIVLFEGKPLQAGTVMFQPVGGQPSQARIRPDGTFTMETFGHGPGAVVGHCRVAVTCFESDVAGGGKEGADEVALGRSLVPERYAQYATSGIEVDVRPGQNELVRIELTK